MSRSFTTRAIVLHQRNFGEADRLITFFTPQSGKIRALAKGVRRLTSRKSGNLNLFNLVEVLIIKGKNLDLVGEVVTQDSFFEWRSDLVKVAVAYYFCELVDHLTAEEQSNKRVFEILENSLRGLNQGNLKFWVRQFEENLLDELGFGVPAEWRRKSGSLRSYIETVIEREVYSPKILNDLFKKN